MTQNLFERLGGEAAVDAVVKDFYVRVLADERISDFFDDIDMPGQEAKQKAFLTLAFGGPNDYSGRDLTTAHAGLIARGLNDSHFDAVAENLVATLKSLGVSDDDITEVVAIVETTRDPVLGRV